MRQAALPLAWPAAEQDRDFLVSAANAQAVRHLDHRDMWPVQAAILTGPRKSGRSLLGRLFVGRTGGLLADDAEQWEEEALFHLWNRAQADRRPLLIVADAPPPAWAIALPDLRSRLAATPAVAIHQPDDALIGALMEKLLGRRGLPTPPAVIAWAQARIERSYVGVIRMVDALDEVALRRRAGMTLAVAREALHEIGGAADD